MTTNIPTTELLEVLENEYATKLRPATLQELGDHFNVSAAAVRYALLAHVERGEVYKLPGARGYMPAWAAHAIAAEGLKRVQDPFAREKLEQYLNPPVKALVCDCMHTHFGVIQFPNPSTADQRSQVARDHFNGTRFIIDAILPTDGEYEVIVHPGVCDCGSATIARKCTICGAWICEDCESDHDHGG